MRTLILGYGEVGKSLEKVLTYPTTIVDKEHTLTQAAGSTDIEVMNVCFPYSEEFISQVKEYQKKYKPKYTIIHSTVPVGTSRKLNAVHSPIIGIHPHLEKSLKTFTKFLGGSMASEVADYFRRAGMKVYLFNKPETTELMKILDTTHYGIEIEYVKEIKKQCEKAGVPFEAWSIWVENYNKGYEKLGYSEYCKPNLVPIMKRQGGHCVLQNCELIDSIFATFLKKLNEES